MPDEVVTQGKQEEGTKTPFLQEVREKSFQQILQEQRAAREQANGEEKPKEESEEEKKKQEEEKLAKEAEEAKKKVEEDEAFKKHDEEIAKKAAEETIKKQEEAKAAEEAKRVQEEEEKKKQEALKPRFTGKDKDGKEVPKSYEELVEEGARIGEERALARMKAEQEAAKKQEEAAKQAQAQTAEQQKAVKEATEARLQKEMDTDLTAMYAAGDMPKVKDAKDEKDPGNLEFKHLLETAQTVNLARIKNNQEPIFSLQVIRYGKDEKGKPYYTPLSKPAGHDAPVLGSESPVSSAPSDEDKYIPSRDRHMPWSVFMKKEAQRLSKKTNVRGK